MIQKSRTTILAVRWHSISMLFAVAFAAVAFIFSCSESSGNSNIGICGGKEYDTTVYFCERGELVGSCRGNSYYPEYDHCENGVIKDGAEISGSSSSIGGSSVRSSSSVGDNNSYSSPSFAFAIVTIGSQTWMAKNLDSDVPGSKCYGEGGQVYEWDEVQANCEKYGRLYDWATAMDLPLSCNDNSCSSHIKSKHQGICPSGWHIPSNDDWDKLFRWVDGQNGGEGSDEYGFYESYTAGMYLKATSGWNNHIYYGGSGNGTDKYGFSALPGGCGSYNYFGDAGFKGYWWSSDEHEEDDKYHYDNAAYNRNMDYHSGGDTDCYKGYKDFLLSVRCLQD